ncbi:MAG: NTP/NDP exchange transporter [Alphaproteobacteria bacterium]|nr:NTP/NDP exchange transporter [Alphaproteobacteria bacterium]MBP9776393.1 NTP/NDP exchange transporter [Alphaproteobacteria bacterium]
MMSSQNPEFSKLRTALWPIQNKELKKFLPMGMLMFFCLFNYTILRNTKDALIITAPACGAEVITFLKPCVMVCAVLFFFGYTQLSNNLNRENLFYACLIPFLIFFGAFAFIIYPHTQLLHPPLESVAVLRETYPHFKWIISLYGVWSYAIFYILAELWGVVVVSLLFWQFANEITRTNEAKRFYSFFGLMGNFSLIIAGTSVEWLAGLNKNRASDADAWGMSLTYMMIAVVTVCVAILLIYWWMNRYVLTDPLYYAGAESVKKTKDDNRPKLSFRESLGYIFSSKYLGLMAILLLSFGISMNLMDVTWKSQLKAYLPNSNDYFEFMGRFSYCTGIATIVLILITKGIIRRFGWFAGAIITPIMVLVTSAAFFAFVLLQDNLDGIAAFLGVTSLLMAVIIGAIQNILSKGTKYSLFDPTKEMAYIPLEQELKVKGKAAVDVIGGRLGKSGGGMIQFILLTLTTGSQLSIAPYLFGIIAFVSLSWICAVKSLSKLYAAKLAEQKNVTL